MPEVVITLGARSGGRRLEYGHFAVGAWQRGADQLAELFIGGEGLERGPVPTLGTLLHEAVHGQAAERGIKDTSPHARYHNARFHDLAVAIGIEVEHDSSIGWSVTTVPAATAAAYAREVDALDNALTAWRRPTVGGSGRASNNNGVSAACDCGRRIRVSESVLEAAPITCGARGSEFVNRQPCF